MSVGQSEYTPLKEQFFGDILAMQSRVAASALNRIANIYGRAKGNYLFIDATAGSGILDDDEPGSPLVAQRVIDEVAGKYGITYYMMLIEKDQATCGSLYTVMAPNEHISIDHADYTDVLSKFSSRPYQYGLLYVDANGIPNFEAVAAFARKMPKIDILFSICANGLKRNRTTSERLTVQMAKIGKAHWLIRRPFSKWQWTFLLGSGYQFKDYGRIELTNINSPQGQAWLEQVDNTKEEVKKKTQPYLTGLMPNT